MCAKRSSIFDHYHCVGLIVCCGDECFDLFFPLHEKMSRGNDQGCCSVDATRLGIFEFLKDLGWTRMGKLFVNES